jgi:hypothetical protein
VVSGIGSNALIFAAFVLSGIEFRCMEDQKAVGFQGSRIHGFRDQAFRIRHDIAPFSATFQLP